MVRVYTMGFGSLRMRDSRLLRLREPRRHYQEWNLDEVIRRVVVEKRADLLLVDGNPNPHIPNRVVSLVA